MEGQGGLEDRLRGLILGNAGATKQPQQVHIPSSQGLQALQQFSAPSNIPNPDPMSESRQSSNLSNQAENFGPAKGGRKKLNQAQRRQMSSQLSIPIDPRPQAQGMVRGNGNGSYHGQQRVSPHQNMQYQARQYQNGRPSSNPHNHSAAYQGPPLSPYDPSLQIAIQQGRSPLQPVHIYSPPQVSPFGEVDPRARYGSGPQDWRSHPGQHRGQPQHRQLYEPGNASGSRGQMYTFSTTAVQAQSAFLQGLIDSHVETIAIEKDEIFQKESFRIIIETACREAIKQHEWNLGHTNFDPASVQLKCFGSMASGFATKASDMDLALLTPLSIPRPESAESEIPRLLERTLLELGYGTRLITRTRVPIIKICEKPTRNLMADLQEERRKYEQGIAEVVTEVQVVEQSGTMENSDRKGTPEHNDDNVGGSPSGPKENLYESQLSSLHQKPDQSLGDYYDAAKRVLFKLGGYDIGLSGTGPAPAVLPPDKWEILNDVSRTFIQGLLDKDVRHALLSINASTLDSLDPLPASLSGVYCQAQIERLAKVWPSRPIQEINEKQEELSWRAIMEWNQLTWQAPEDPSVQNKHLYQLLDRVKRINSLQFATLKQQAYENAQAYYQRMARMLEGPENMSSSLPVVFKQYTTGISDPVIQNRLRTLIEGPGTKRMGPKALLFHHLMLQLANEYERALSMSIFDEADRSAVEAYVSLLRGSQNLNWPETEKYFEDLSQSAEAARLIARIKQLPEPSGHSKPRDRYYDHLSFPSDDSVGIQCDINFSADLALHNTHLLRCYAAADPRVRPMVLFVKSWASRRGINTPYRGTLSSYGYVLMVLHYLVNVATPFVLPNLQLLRRLAPPNLSPAEAAALDTCNGLNVGFWRDEQEIRELAQRKQLTQNHDSLGKLLRGFFEYYANNGGGFRGFEWAREVLSLRTQGGILTKTEKGWTGARTTTETITTAHANPNSNTKDATDPKSPLTPAPKKTELIKEVRHRYLFAIEDPFEIEHNIARTVNHEGIVSIRDEFRRAWRIIKDHSAQNSTTKMNLLADVTKVEKKANDDISRYKQMMHDILEGGLSGYVARGGTPAGYEAYVGGQSELGEEMQKLNLAASTS